MTLHEKFKDVKCPECAGAIEAVVTVEDHEHYALEGLRCKKCDWIQMEIERESVGHIWKARDEWNRSEWRRKERIKSGEALKDCNIQFDGKTLVISDGYLTPFESAYDLLVYISRDNEQLSAELAAAGNDVERIAGEAADEVTHGLSLSKYAKWGYVNPDGDEWVDDEEYWDEYTKMVWKEIQRECKARKINVQKARDEFLECDDKPNHELFDHISDAKKTQIGNILANAKDWELEEVFEKIDEVIQEILENTTRAHAKELLDGFLPRGMK